MRRALPVTALLAVYLALGLGIAARKSNTYDEAFHVSSGYAYLSRGIDHFGAKNHPVLGRAITALLPWALLDLDFDASVAPDFAPGTGYHRYAGRFLYENRVPGDRILLLARLSNLLLGALLGVFVHRWAREAWGDAAAATALFLYALSPVVLANASLATTDLPIAAFFTMTCYFLQRLARGGPPARDVLGAGLCLGLALAVKYTSVLLVPLALAACALRLRREGPGRAAAAFALVLALAYAVVWTAYGWRYASSGPSFGGFPWERFSGLAAEPLVRTLRALHALPESYLYGVLGSLSDAGTGKPAFLMGRHSMDGWWYYFLVAFLIKTPIAALALLGAAIARLLPRREDRERALWVLGPAVLLAAFVSAQRINIGIRHILPAYPLLCVLGGAAVPAGAWSRRLPRAALLAALGWYLGAALWVFPDQLAYFNELVGGPKNGYKYLVDSNLDWGQDLKGLKEYMDRTGIARIKLAYFGFADPHWFGIDYEYLPSVSVLNPVPAEEQTELTGWFAISATLLQGVYLQHQDLYAEFRTMEPVATIGHSIFVYRL
jgi:hypothetical protein